MSLEYKSFADRLNHCLDETDAPTAIRERSNILSKLIDIPKQQAWAILEAREMPDDQLLEKIANEFEVTVPWLKEGK